MNRRTKSRYYENEAPNYRSVGSKPCNFNKLKQCTIYRSFGRDSFPRIDPIDQNQIQRQAMAISLKTDDPNKGDKDKSPAKRKIAVMVDKWKQRYEKAQESCQNRKKSFDVLPTINKKFAPLVMVSTKDKFYFQKNESQSTSNRDDLSPQNKQIKHRVIQKFNLNEPSISLQKPFQKYSSFLKLSEEPLTVDSPTFGKKHKQQKLMLKQKQKLKYSVQLHQNSMLHKNSLLNNQRRSLNNIFSLKQVQEMPQRWEVNGDELVQWN